MKKRRSKKTMGISTPEMRKKWKEIRDYWKQYEGEKCCDFTFNKRVALGMPFEEAIIPNKKLLKIVETKLEIKQKHFYTFK